MPPQQNSEKLTNPEKPTKPDVYTAIILDEAGRILLSTRPKDRDFPDQPALISGIGSSKKKGLSGIAAARDEVNADLGTTTFEGQEIFKLRLPQRDRAGNNIVYVGNINKDDIKLNKELSNGFDWYTLEDALQLDLAFDHKHILERYKKHQTLQADSQKVYKVIHEGIPEKLSDKNFIEQSATQIAKISAANIAMELGLDENQIEFYLQFIKDQYLSQLRGYYTSDNKINVVNEAAIKNVINNSPRLYDQTYLSQLAEVIGLGTFDKQSQIPRLTLFSTIIDYCRNKLPGLDQYSKIPDKNQILEFVQSQMKGAPASYVNELTTDLSHHFPESDARELNAREQDYMKLSLHLANFVWQIAKLPQYCLEHNKYLTGPADQDSKRLADWQHLSFPEMLAGAFKEYSQRKDLQGDPLKILIMVAFKVFQDLHEYQVK